VEAELLYADGQTHIIAFRSFESAPKKEIWM